MKIFKNDFRSILVFGFVIGLMSMAYCQEDFHEGVGIYNFSNCDKKEPPNCVFLNDTLMIDRTEISNLDWKEYRAYISRRYGKYSDEFNATCPDTSGFMINVHPEKKLRLSKAKYIFGIKYDDYPVVGVTLAQVKEYSKWRSDIVFQTFLVNSNLLEYRLPENWEEQYTIEQFLNSNPSDDFRKMVTHYPVYFIPSSLDWSILKGELNEGNVLTGYVNSKEENHSSVAGFGLSLIEIGEYEEEMGSTLINILGNVAELIDDEGYAMGGSYENSMVEISRLEKYKSITPSSSVGFRNFCKWVEIKYTE